MPTLRCIRSRRHLSRRGRFRLHVGVQDASTDASSDAQRAKLLLVLDMAAAANKRLDAALGAVLSLTGLRALQKDESSVSVHVSRGTSAAQRMNPESAPQDSSVQSSEGGTALLERP